MNSLRFLILFMVVFAASGLSVLIGHLETFTGDLTRIGALPDAAFRPQQVIEPIDPQHRVNTPIAQADVIVIGDSFSLPLKWQSELVRAGLTVHTTHWSSLQDGNQHPLVWLQNSGARKDAMLVLQMVERFANDRIANLDKSVGQTLSATIPSASAAPAKPQSGNGKPAVAQPTGGVAPPASAQTARMSTGMRLLINRIRLNGNAGFVSRYPGSGDATRVRPLDDGCRYFSNSRCDRLLTLQQDETQPRFRPENRQMLDSVHQRLTQQYSSRVLWLIIPNKSTIYAEAEPSDADLAALDFYGNRAGPNLFREWARSRKPERDFYMPNDTHLSDNGYRELGSGVAAARSAGRSDQNRSR